MSDITIEEALEKTEYSDMNDTVISFWIRTTRTFTLLIKL